MQKHWSAVSTRRALHWHAAHVPWACTPHCSLDAGRGQRAVASGTQPQCGERHTKLAMYRQQLVISFGWREQEHVGHAGLYGDALGHLDQRLAAGSSAGMLKHRIRSFATKEI